MAAVGAGPQHGPPAGFRHDDQYHQRERRVPVGVRGGARRPARPDRTLPAFCAHATGSGGKGLRLRRHDAIWPLKRSIHSYHIMKLTKAALFRTWQTKNQQIILVAYIAIAVIAAAQGLLAGPKVYVPGGRPYIDYNNFRIFKFSFYHLIHGKDIYQLFPDDHWDLYKYSPAFALCFGLLSWMPDPIGLLLWNLINSLCLYAGIRMLPGLDDERKSRILLLCLLEMLLSIQNTQSNGLMAGLTVLGFALAERRNYFLSTLCIVFSFYIKIYGALAFIFYLFYPGKLKSIGWSVFWMLLFAVLPLAVISGQQLTFLYKSWLHLLVDDRTASTGVSVIGIMVSWFHAEGAKNVVTLVGVFLLLLPLIRIRQYRDL